MTTKRQVEAAGVGWHPDPRCQGLALWVKPNGAKRWVLDYRINGRQRRITLGHADVLTPDEAAKLARKYRVAIDHGRDPLAEKEAERRATEAAMTLSTFFQERYLPEHAEVKKKKRSADDDKKRFHRTIAPKLGRLRVPDITDEDVRRFHRGLKDTPIEANRAVALLSKMFSLAEAWKLRPAYSNPCRHVPRYPETKKHRFLSAEQLQALGRALAESERASKDDDAYEAPVMLAGIRLALFAGMRHGEVLGLKWQDVNLEAGLIDLADSKTGRKTVVLNAPARQVLDTLAKERKEGAVYVLSSRWPDRPLSGLAKSWGHIRKRAGLDGVRLHDLRHTFGSTGAGLGQGLPVIGALLGHSVPQTTQRYAGVAQDPRREAAERIGERLAALVSPPETSATVLPMKKPRQRRHA